MKNDKKIVSDRKNRTALGILCSLFVLCMAAGCSNSSDVAAEERGGVMQNAEAAQEVVENKEQDFMTAEEFHDTYMSTGEVEITVSQPGNYIINGVELCDAVEPSDDMDDAWEGYTEQDLGLLPPSKMPNVIVDEAGNHGVMYKNEYYIYVNDTNRRHGEKSGFSKYANVWCTPNAADCKILGGWEEYGKACAEKGIIVE